jgi:DNA modification methylase
MNHLYYGDNLDIMRRYIGKESVDLLYLDPPFNSSRNYNVIFERKSDPSAARQGMPPALLLRKAVGKKLDTVGCAA